MSVYKELRVIAELEKQQVRIYPDACDFGIPVKSFEDAAVKILAALIDMYKFPKKVIKYATGTTQVVEYDGEYPMIVEAGFEKFRIEYITTRKDKNMIGYISIVTETTKEGRAKANQYLINEN